MSELSSAFPVSGGLYFWAFMLADKHGPFASWLVGWLNLLGQVNHCCLLQTCWSVCRHGYSLHDNIAMTGTNQSCWLAEACTSFFFYCAAVFACNPNIILVNTSCVYVYMYASLLSLVSTVILVSKA